MKVVQYNIGCTLKDGLVSREGVTTQDQLNRLVGLAADVYILQELVGSTLDQYTQALGPHAAHYQMRFFNQMATAQSLGVLSRHPIDEVRAVSLGFLHHDGIEVEERFKAHGREVQSAACAAKVITPLGAIWFVAAHGAWTRRTHEGLQPHQRQSLQRLQTLLDKLAYDGCPILLGADFNALLTDVAPFMPANMQGLTAQEDALFGGKSLDLDRAETMEMLRTNGVVVDGVFHTPSLRHQNLEVLRGVSDHAGLIFNLELATP